MVGLFTLTKLAGAPTLPHLLTPECREENYAAPERQEVETTMDLPYLLTPEY